MLKELVVCSGNAGKVKELSALLPGRIKLRSLVELGLPLDLPESGDRLEENALEKARFCHERCRKPCVADDSGLEVEALDGAPGVYSARYGGPEKDPIRNMDKVLNALEGASTRKARFRTVIAFVGADGERTFEGSIDGTIIGSPRGVGGFGYDPIFLPEGEVRTFAEMDAGEKNAISHRGRAMQALVAFLVSDQA